MKTHCWTAVMVLHLATAGWEAAAQSSLVGGSYLLIGQTAGGGGESTGTSWWLSGSIPSPICAVSVGGSYELNGGLVGAYSVPTEGVRLQAEWIAGARARLSWTAEAQAQGFRLEFTTTLGPGAAWEPIAPEPSGASHVVKADQPARFYRLRRP